MYFLMNMLDSEPMKYARVVESIEKVFDGRTNDIKEEKSWNEHINVLLDKKNRRKRILWYKWIFSINRNYNRWIW